MKPTATPSTSADDRSERIVWKGSADHLHLVTNIARENGIEGGSVTSSGGKIVVYAVRAVSDELRQVVAAAVASAPSPATPELVTA